MQPASCRKVVLFVSVFILLLPLFLSAEESPIELRVMTFNIWYGGEQASFGQVAEVIRAARPDVIGIQEPDGNLRKLADAIGYSYIDEKRYIISRYPLFDPDLGKNQHVYTWVLVRPGAVVAFANTHLSSTPFGPDLIREGKSHVEVETVERNLRLAEVKPFAEELSGLVARGIPVFFTGDFNTPSHLDWTPQAAESGLHNKLAFEWPVTKLLADSGLRDSYRELFPDPVKNPGLTWTPGYPNPWVKADEILDRIDMIWSGGKTTALESKIIGESGNPAVDFAVSPYPSDHRAVVSAFRVIPVEAPAMVAVDTRRIEEGQDILVRFQLPNHADWGLVIVPENGNVSKEAIVSAKGPNLLSTRPSFKLSSLGMRAGVYDAVLQGPDEKELARTRFWIAAKNAVPELHAEHTIYKVGDAIKVFFSGAPGLKNDWVGVYKAGDTDTYGGYLAFVYTGASIEGSIIVETKAISPELTPGKYELRLMRDDSYVMLARTSIELK